MLLSTDGHTYCDDIPEPRIPAHVCGLMLGPAAQALTKCPLSSELRSCFRIQQTTLARTISIAGVVCVICLRKHGILMAQVNVLTGMAEMVTRSIEKDWIAKQRRESAKLLLSADLKVSLRCQGLRNCHASGCAPST